MSKDKENNEPLIDPEELKDLDESSSEKEKAIQLMGVLLGFLLFTVAHNIYSIVSMYTDESIPLVSCPRNFENGRPVLLKTMDKTSDVEVDNWIRSFAITYVRARYPRNVKDVEPMYHYVMTRSKDSIRRDFQGRLSDIEAIMQKIKGGNFVQFWFESSQEISIRKIEDEGRWAVSIEGYMHKKTGNKKEKTQPTIKLIVEKGKPILSNPEGLYVVDYEVRYITDPISGETVEL